jgi:excisionase family DNA binding protein
MHNVISRQPQGEGRSTKVAGPATLGAEDLARAYTVEQVAAMLRISRSTAYKCVETGEIPSLRLRRRIVIPAEAIEALLSGV